MNAACEFSADARLRAFFREAVLGPAFTPGRKTALSVYMSAPFTGLLCFYGAFRSCNPFQAVVRLSAGVVLALVLDIFFDPREVPGSKRHDAVAGLPLEYSSLCTEPLVSLVRRCSLELADEFGDGERRGDGYHHVDMRFRAANLVEKRARSVDDSLFHAAMDQRLDLRIEERHALLAVPGDVEIDLAVVVVAHGVFGYREGGP